MTIQPLTEQFTTAQKNINLGWRRQIAIAAHLEVRAVLRLDDALNKHGLDDVLIGSYARDTSIWPGKDVDVFGKLTSESVDSIAPLAAFELFMAPLLDAFDDRVVLQDRSINVAFTSKARPGTEFIREAAAALREAVASVPADPYEFSVDVVPAVHDGVAWGIPDRNRDNWKRTAAAERWTTTNPEVLTSLSQQCNKLITISGQGAYVPTVKAIRQIRRHHLGPLKPGGLYYELILYEGFTTGQITGESWAEVTSSALSYVAARLTTVFMTPLCDPALKQQYQPTPDPAAINQAAIAFAQLARDATTALHTDVCPAAAAWRRIFGDNGQANGAVFPLPTNCRADGSMMPVITSPNPLRGTNEARGFGEH